MDRNGWSVSETPEITWREWENKATGEVKRIPVGIAPGFDYNVGIANLRVKAREQVAEKLKKLIRTSPVLQLTALCAAMILLIFIKILRGILQWVLWTTGLSRP